MKKLFYTLTILASAALVACGRPSSSNLFTLDGVGTPQQPIGNPVPGKWGGTISMGNWVMLPDSYTTSVFGVNLPVFNLSEAYFNKKDIAGLGGLDLLLLGIPAPPRLPAGQTSTCYMDPAAFPLLGGTLESRDVGEDIDLDFGPDDFRISRDQDDELDDPTSDTLIWFNILETEIPYDSDIDAEWDGGTLGNKGFATAPPFQGEVLHFPEDLTGPGGTGLPTVNGDPMTNALIPIDDTYRIQWEEANETQDLLGTQIVVTVYGPSNLGDNVEYDFIDDNPFFNRLAHMVCLVADGEEEFTIPHTALEELLALAMSTGKYEFSSEDVNGNGELDERACGGIPPVPCVEDGNRNGVIDSIYGIALTVNRRAERELNYCINGSCDTSRVLVNGNSLKMGKFEFASAPPAP